MRASCEGGSTGGAGRRTLLAGALERSLALHVRDLHASRRERSFERREQRLARAERERLEARAPRERLALVERAMERERPEARELRERRDVGGTRAELQNDLLETPTESAPARRDAAVAMPPENGAGSDNVSGATAAYRTAGRTVATRDGWPRRSRQRRAHPMVPPTSEPSVLATAYRARPPVAPSSARDDAPATSASGSGSSAAPSSSVKRRA